MQNTYISDQLIKTILSGYKLPWNGVHGITHWARVMENGLRLAEQNEADPEIIALFAILHDCKRQNESRDYGHAKRGADFAYTLKGNLLTLDDNRFDLLYYACSYHTEGKTEGDITIRTCWDSDRLDLYRVKIKTDPDRLCTEEAKNPKVLAWAVKRAEVRFVPDIVNIWKNYI